ncbi:MAG TPA: PAS domain S-box protein [Gaiellaceae bacterium]|nr:PAS domain S-box protein [Gaiellaceae bacterium]
MAAAVGVALVVLFGIGGGVMTGSVVGVTGWAFDDALVVGGVPVWYWALPAFLLAGAVAGVAAGLLRRRSRQLRSLELRESAVWNAVGEGLVRLDPGALIAAWSPGAAELYGHTEADAVGRPLAELFVDAEQARELLAAVQTGERPAGVRVMQRRADGGEFEAALALLPAGASSEGGTMLVVRDVEALSRAVASGAELEAKYQSLIAHVPAISYARLPEAGATRQFMTERVRRLLGYSSRELLVDRELFVRLVHPEDRDRVADELGVLPEPGGATRIEYRLIARDGRTVWVEDVSAVVLGDGGRPLCVQGFLHDVSELRTAAGEQLRLQAAQTRAAEEARLRQQRIVALAEIATTISRASALAVAIRDVAALVIQDFAAWFVVDVFDQQGDLVRLAREHAVISGNGASPASTPESWVIEAVTEGASQIDESHIFLPLLARGGRRLGALTLLADMGRSYDEDDLGWAQALAGLLGATIEKAHLHEEVEARADARRVLENMGEGVFLVDQEGVVRSWNPAAEAITGLKAAELVGAEASSVIPGWSEIARISVVGSHEAALVEAVPLEMESSEQWIAISAVRFLDGTVYAFHDITEAHRLDQLQAEFTATASHELRTPLAAVYGAAQTLLRHDFALDEAGRDRFIHLIVDESERLGRIVNQILLANQLDVGRVDLETEPFDANDLLNRVAEATRVHAPENIEVDVGLSDRDLLVTADRDKVRQILLNLVENAIKYSPDGGNIELGAEPAGSAVRFHVLDEGLGIPAEERTRIFDKFYRLDPDMTQGVGGTGLGLYICAGLVTRMAGRIWVEAGQEGGSAFFFELPQARAYRNKPSSQREESAGLVMSSGAETEPG